MSNEVVDGMIELDSPFAKEIGFTSDKFDGYLWKDGGRILISFILSRHPGQGNLSNLFETIEGKGFQVAVPSPLPGMQQILEAKGYEPSFEHDERFGEVDVWTKVRDPEPLSPKMWRFIEEVLVNLDPDGMELDEFIEKANREFVLFEASLESEEE